MLAGPATGVSTGVADTGLHTMYFKTAVTFTGTSPCDANVQDILIIPGKCEQVKWKLMIFYEEKPYRLLGYRLSIEYGYYIDNRTYKVTGNSETHGNCVIIKGTRSDPDATVYQLNPGSMRSPLFFLKLDDNLLHLLNTDKSLMVGHSGASYTLSKLKT